MKHPHENIIKQWLEDTTQEIEFIPLHGIDSSYSNINQAINDVAGNFKLRIKPKPDEYEHLRHALSDGKKIEVFFMDKWKVLKNGESLDTLIDTNKYRIVDEYEHLRNALRDGKNIDFYNGHSWDSKRFYDDGGEFIHAVVNYRIHDQYRELKEAQEQGKRVIRLKDDGGFVECFFGRKFDFDYDEFTPEQYKIVEYDIKQQFIIILDKFNQVRIELTKSGIDGTIKAEVINE